MIGLAGAEEAAAHDRPAVAGREADEALAVLALHVAATAAALIAIGIEEHEDDGIVAERAAVAALEARIDHPAALDGARTAAGLPIANDPQLGEGEDSGIRVGRPDAQ